MTILYKLKEFLKRAGQVILSRPFLVAVMMLLQFGIFILLPIYFREFSLFIRVALHMLTYIAVLWLVQKDENPHFKLSWSLLLLFFPHAGALIYFLFAHRRMPDKLEKHMRAHLEPVNVHIPQRMMTEPTEMPGRVQSRYVYNTSSYPSYSNTKVTYYSDGSDLYNAILYAMREAKEYIFLEFFIIKEGYNLDRLLNILVDRISAGVEVYFIYDDMGTMLQLPSNFSKKLQDMGIHVCAFNPFRPHLSPILNYRDHRKIVVVDGNVSFCGGINVADEYTNNQPRFGHWKDSGVRLEGEATWSFAVMFLQQWRFGTGEALFIPSFIPKRCPPMLGDGLVQVYGDSPLVSYNIAENVYLNAIRQAESFIYIATPYLVIDRAMENALCAAAASGVDVRIITPHIHDKWYVHILTQSHYPKLVREGVKIYEYTPGFIHSKMFLADDSIGMVGTSNMDFRSFYYHFECSVLLYGNSVLKELKEDFLETHAQSQRITLEETENISWSKWLLQTLFKMFAPLF